MKSTVSLNQKKKSNLFFLLVLILQRTPLKTMLAWAVLNEIKSKSMIQLNGCISLHAVQ